MKHLSQSQLQQAFENFRKGLLEKLATLAAASVNCAISPAMVAVTVSRMVATVVLTAVLSTMGRISITREYEFANYIGYGSGN